MIGTDQDVMNTRRYELPDHSQYTLPRSGKILGLGMVDVQNHLRGQGIALVDIDERLMLRIVSEHLRPNRHHPRRGYVQVAEMQSHRLPLRQNCPLKPLRAQGMTIGGETESGREKVVDCSFLFGNEAGIEELFHWRYSKVMRQVVNVYREGSFDHSRLQLHVKIAEWDGVRNSRRGNEKDCDYQTADSHRADFNIP